MSNVYEDLNRAHKVTDIITWMMEEGIRKEDLPRLADDQAWRRIGQQARVSYPSLRTRKLLFETLRMED